MDGEVNMKRLIRSMMAVFLIFGTTPVQAEEDYGLWMDFNQDGRTDQNDWNSLRDWMSTYTSNNEDGSLNYGGQEMPASISLLINDHFSSAPADISQTDVSALKEFYLINGYSTPVRNQNPFGSCWAFATISSLESNFLLKQKGLPDPKTLGTLNFHQEDSSLDFSELYLAMENRTPVRDGSQKGEGSVTTNENTGVNMINSGGFLYDSQSVLSSWDGPLKEEQEPYRAVKPVEDEIGEWGFHNEQEDLSTVPESHVQKVLYLDSPSRFHLDIENRSYVYDGYDADAVKRIKQAILQYGAVVCCYEADISNPGDSGSSDYMNYREYAQYYDSDEIQMNHAVSIVGWNDSYPKENFAAERNSVPAQDGAWLIKNSWGNYSTVKEIMGDRVDELLESSRGTDQEITSENMYNYGIKDEEGHGTGYFWLSYADHSFMSAVAFDAEPKGQFSYDHLYQYDYMHTASFSPVSLPSEKPLKTANIFTAAEDETLKAVSVYSPVNQTKTLIEIYLLEDGETTPSDRPVSVMEVTLDRGFHTVDLKDAVPLKKGTRFVVAEHAESVHEGKPISWLLLETSPAESLQNDENMNNVHTHTVCNEGETIFKTEENGSWQSTSALNRSPASEAFAFGNAMIKAYTVDGISEVIPAVTESSAAPSATVPAAAASSPFSAIPIVIAAVAAVLVSVFLCRD